MCKLFGMSTSVPTDTCSSFTGLVQRGGGIGSHKDGWGITFYEDKGCRAFRDPQPGFNSPIVKLVQNYPIRSYFVVVHIHQANRGEIALENTHPSTHELWRRNWTYAHNGQLSGYESLEIRNFRPVDETDSEKAFCWLPHKLTERYPRTFDNMTAIFRCIAMLAEELRERSVFDISLSDRRYVTALCSTNLSRITRRTPFGVVTLPGQDVEIDFSPRTTLNNMVTMVATQPLTGNETWQKIMPGEWALLCLGERVV